MTTFDIPYYHDYISPALAAHLLRQATPVKGIDGLVEVGNHVVLVDLPNESNGPREGVGDRALGAPRAAADGGAAGAAVVCGLDGGRGVGHAPSVPAVLPVFEM